MKYFILTFVFALTHQLLAFEVQLINAYTNSGFEGGKVLLISVKGKVIEEAISNEEGIASFNAKKGKKDKIRVVDDSEDFYLSLNTIYRNGRRVYYFFPTDAHYEELLAIEDSIYGKAIKKDSMGNYETNPDYIEAEYPGGAEDMQLFIVNELYYPQVAIEMNDQGRVYVSFVVEKDGNITHVYIVKSVSKELDDEARRVIWAMPNWEKGLFKDEPIRVCCWLPIIYELN